MKKHISAEIASLHHYDDEYPEKSQYEVVERSPWEDEGKYQFMSVILQDKTDGTYWRYWITRSGSYFTEYYYDYSDVSKVEIEQVEKVEVTVTEWKAVKE